MALARTPFELATLPPAVAKALGPGPAKMMASRGMVPLPPAEQAILLYSLSLDTDGSLASAAVATAKGLPESILGGILGDAKADPRVLDFFTDFVSNRPGLFDAAVLNPSLADQTVARLATKADAREIDLIAQNEQRLLRHPEIIGAMYLNTRARMSTVDRAVELAIRNSIRVPGIAAWEEISKALMGGAPAAAGDQDALFANAAAAFVGDDSALTAGNAEELTVEVGEDGLAEVSDVDAAGNATVDGQKVPIDKLSIPSKLRLAALGNAFARSTLIRDPIKIVALAAIKSPSVSDMEAGRYAKNATLADDVIRYIANNGKWTKIYGIKVALCFNPKTPIPDVGRMLPFLREKDLKSIAKSKGIPSAVAANARRLLSQRSNGK